MESSVESIITPEISREIKSAFISKMGKAYTLVYVDYRDSFDECPKIIQECLDSNSMDPIFDSYDNWYDTGIECSDLIDGLKKEILADKDFITVHDYLEEWIEDYENKDAIRNEIEDRDNSDPVEKLIENSTLRGRATLFTNYD